MKSTYEGVMQNTRHGVFVDAVLADAIAAAIVREFHVCETVNPNGHLHRLPDTQARAEIAGLVQIVTANNAVRVAAEPRTLDGLVGASELEGK